MVEKIFIADLFQFTRGFYQKLENKRPGELQLRL